MVKGGVGWDGVGRGGLPPTFVRGWPTWTIKPGTPPALRQLLASMGSPTTGSWRRFVSSTRLGGAAGPEGKSLIRFAWGGWMDGTNIVYRREIPTLLALV